MSFRPPTKYLNDYQTDRCEGFGQMFSRASLVWAAVVHWLNFGNWLRRHRIHSDFAGSCCAAAGLRSVDLHVLRQADWVDSLCLGLLRFGWRLNIWSSFSHPIHTHFSPGRGHFCSVCQWTVSSLITCFTLPPIKQRNRAEQQWRGGRSCLQLLTTLFHQKFFKMRARLPKIMHWPHFYFSQAAWAAFIRMNVAPPETLSPGTKPPWIDWILNSFFIYASPPDVDNTSSLRVAEFGMFTQVSRLDHDDV